MYKVRSNLNMNINNKEYMYKVRSNLNMYIKNTEYMYKVHSNLNRYVNNTEYMYIVQDPLQPKHVQILYNIKYRLQVQVYVVHMLFRKNV